VLNAVMFVGATRGAVMIAKVWISSDRKRHDDKPRTLKSVLINDVG